MEDNLSLQKLSEQFSGGTWNLTNKISIKTSNINEEDLYKRFQKFISSCEVIYNINDLNNVDFQENTGSSVQDSSTVDLKIAVKTAVDIDKFGRRIKYGSVCPHCGKHVDFIHSFGFCSIKCFLEDLTEKSTYLFNGSLKETDDIIENIENFLKIINITTNLILEFPIILEDLTKIPETYQEYFLLKLNIEFIKLQKKINQFIIFKNKNIIKLLTRISKYKLLDKNLQKINQTISTILNVCNLMENNFDLIYTTVYKSLTETSKFFSLPPQSIGFFSTNPTLFTATEKYLYKLSIDNMLSSDFNITSTLSNIDFQKLNKEVQKKFPPIQEAEYFLDPDAFKLRLIFSDQNQTAVTDFTNTLSKVFTCNADYLPRYTNLTLTNPWFLAALIWPGNPKNFGFVTKRLYKLI